MRCMSVHNGVNDPEFTRGLRANHIMASYVHVATW